MPPGPAARRTRGGTIEDRIAAVVAAAFLDGRWEVGAMAARAAHDLGPRDAGHGAAGAGGWLHRTAHAVVVAHPAAPLDGPRQLRALVAALLTRERPVAGERARGPDDGRRGVPALVPTQMGEAPWPVVPLPDVGAVERALGLPGTLLDWYADVRSLERTATAEPLRHYRYRWVAKRSGGARLLEQPKPRLRAVQRQLLRDVLDAVPPHPAATAFRAGGSAHVHAARHAGRRVVVAMDLEGFFEAVGPGRVFRLLRSVGYPEPVAHVLTGLMTNAVPEAVLRPATGAAGARALPAATRRRQHHHLRAPHLPQGAPTSPALANLVAVRLDQRLTGLAERFGATYSRYADDLAFSGGDDLRRGADRLIAHVRRISAAEGFRANDAKTRVMPAWTRQRVAGLVVNAGAHVDRREADRLRAVLHDAVRHGPAAANRSGHPRFREHLQGRIAWVAAGNPGRGDRLRSLFDLIRWDDGA